MYKHTDMYTVCMYTHIRIYVHTDIHQYIYVHIYTKHQFKTF